MKKNDIKVVKVLLSTTVASFLLLTGCSSKPAPKPMKKPIEVKKVIKVYTPAELSLSTSAITTNVKTMKELKRYDLTIYLDNYKNSSAYVNLSNEGESLLKLSNIAFKSETKNLFTLSKECTNTIDPTKKCKLKISFNGKKKGDYTSDIVINSNSNGKYVGKIAKIHVIASAKDRITGLVQVTSKPKPQIEKKPIINLDFVSNNLIQYLEIKNNGIENINIKNFELIGQDKKNFKVTQNCPSVLPSGVSCDIQIAYTKKENATALSYLVINSNGTLSPSDTIRLRGKGTVDKKAPKILKLADNDNMSIKITDVNTTVNTQQFLEDFYSVKPVYYFRTMYQTNTDTKFKEYFENTVTYYFKKNGFRVTQDAHKADKILNIYPKFKVSRASKKDLTIGVDVKVNIVTKSVKSETLNEKLEFTMAVKAKNFSDIYFVYASASNLINSFMFNLLGLEE